MELSAGASAQRAALWSGPALVDAQSTGHNHAGDLVSQYSKRYPFEGTLAEEESTIYCRSQSDGIVSVWEPSSKAFYLAMSALAVGTKLYLK